MTFIPPDVLHEIGEARKRAFRVRLRRLMVWHRRDDLTWDEIVEFLSGGPRDSGAADSQSGPDE